MLVLASGREVGENKLNIQGELTVTRKERFPDLDMAEDADFKGIIRINYDVFRWQEDALCAQVGPEPFFLPQGGSAEEARLICGHCDVRGECLEFAIENEEEFGVWGGLTTGERRKLIKEREAAREQSEKKTA